MTIAEIAEKIEGKILCHEDLSSKEIETACGSDMMSDVMAFYHDRGMLITGLINIQVVRTASLLDLDAVCFVRGKQPTPDMIKLAQEVNVVLIETSLSMFPACGLLYESGIRSSTKESD